MIYHPVRRKNTDYPFCPSGSFDTTADILSCNKDEFDFSDSPPNAQKSYPFSSIINRRTLSPITLNSSLESPDVSIGGRICNRTAAGLIHIWFASIALYYPPMQTGTIGAPVFCAILNPPALNSPTSSLRLRVPSGKIIMEPPS